MWSNDLVTLLVNASVGVATGASKTIFVSSSAAIPKVTPDEGVISIGVTGGSGANETHNSVAQPAYHMPGAQIVARAKTSAAAMAKARAAYLALRIRNTTVNACWYRSIKALQEPFDAGLDEENRAMVIFNVVGDKAYS